MVVCGDLCHFVVVCGRLRWFVVVCGGLGWFAMVCGGLSYSHTGSLEQRNHRHVLSSKDRCNLPKL